LGSSSGFILNSLPSRQSCVHRVDCVVGKQNTSSPPSASQHSHAQHAAATNLKPAKTNKPKGSNQRKAAVQYRQANTRDTPNSADTPPCKSPQTPPAKKSHHSKSTDKKTTSNP